jgi:hypothetical protein
MNVLCLFDKSGLMGKPFAERGCRVLCIDWEADERTAGGIVYERHDLRMREALFDRLDVFKPDIVFSFPDCTDLAVSGAAHFESKRKKDPDFQKKAIELFRTGEIVAGHYGIPSFTENPVSVAATMYRRPEAYFHPWEYGGYLPADDVHPVWPEYIASRDAYPKKTGAWLLDLELPVKKPVPVEPGYSTQHKKLGGKSQKTKDIRSMTPRGFALAMSEMILGKEQDDE